MSDSTQSDSPVRYRISGWIFSGVMFFLVLTGFGQMPIFKRYYIADIPGLGWLAQFYVTHYLHYLGGAIILLLTGYWAVSSPSTTGRFQPHSGQLWLVALSPCNEYPHDAQRMRVPESGPSYHAGTG